MYGNDFGFQWIPDKHSTSTIGAGADSHEALLDFASPADLDAWLAARDSTRD